MSRKRYTPEQIISMLREAEVALAQGQSIGCESRMAVMSTAWFVEFRQRLPWLLQVD